MGRWRPYAIESTFAMVLGRLICATQPQLARKFDMHHSLPYTGRSTKPSWYFITANPTEYVNIPGTLNKYVYLRWI